MYFTKVLSRFEMRGNIRKIQASTVLLVVVKEVHLKFLQHLSGSVCQEPVKQDYSTSLESGSYTKKTDEFEDHRQ